MMRCGDRRQGQMTSTLQWPHVKMAAGEDKS
jgi:hypothetical protein